ncbi:MAG: hypothetical protein J7549_06430 [Variovorax sp.]|nr:hypothetical protein [Variovorax sp.]
MNRPKSGPGSGYGAAYVPDVTPTETAAPDYQGTVAKCQQRATDLPYIRSNEHDEALVLIGTGATAAFMSSTALVGMWEAIALGVGGASYGGFVYWVDTPGRQRWYERQETMLANCMAQAGYANNDPTVKVTWKKYDPTAAELRPTGTDTYGAERLAKARNCGVAPLATLTAKGPGFENHSVPCEARNTTLLVRCEFGNCREVGVTAGLPAKTKVSLK